MDSILFMLIGAGVLAGVLILWKGSAAAIARLQARARAAAGKAQSDLQTRLAAAAGDLETRVRTAISADLAGIKADVAALKTKAGL